MNVSDVVADLKRHEGFRAHAYQDTVGVLTIGYGRNLDDVGISEEEGEHLLLNDVVRAENACRSSFYWYVGLDAVRQGVVVNMCFNLGLGRLRGFRKMLIACSTGDYPTAAKEMLDSTWAAQVGARANELAEQMRTGLRVVSP